jgi:hypothetical protein
MAATDTKSKTCEDVLTAIVGAGEAVRTGAGRKGSPYRYYRPEIHSPGTPSLEQEQEMAGTGGPPNELNDGELS